jgi:hypothetical protein
MKYLIPCSALFLLGFLLTAAGAAEPDRSAEARAALALAAATPAYASAKGKGPYDGPCVCGNGCGCNSTCGCGTTAGCSGDCWPGCETPAARGAARGKAAWRRAVDGNLPYVVWVGGFACPACERECADAVHVHVDSYRGDDTPRVEVGKPDGAGGMDRVASLTGAMGPGRLAGALLGRPTAGVAASGGFGPAFGQGGCAGGACGAVGGFYGPPPVAGGGFFGGGFGSGGGCASCGSGGGRRR